MRTVASSLRSGDSHEGCSGLTHERSEGFSEVQTPIVPRHLGAVLRPTGHSVVMAESITTTLILMSIWTLRKM